MGSHIQITPDGGIGGDGSALGAPVLREVELHSGVP